MILQLNDVYEANPVGGEGGLARVATLRQELQAEGAPVITVLAGDFLSPSAIGLAKVDGERLAGKQMVAAFNALGLDYVTFGNHEFDVKEDQLLARIGESKFKWFSGNVRRGDGKPFPGVDPRIVRTIETPTGTWTIGLLSVTLNSNPHEWVRYDADYVAVAQREVEALKAAGADLIIGLTHLDLDDDEALAEDVPDIDFILGGHEHENVRVYRGRDFTPVLKADANARTVYIHRLTRLDDGQIDLSSELRLIDESIPDEPTVAAVAKTWTDKAFDSFRADGLQPEHVVTTAWVDLDGREASVRNRTTELTTLLAEAVAAGGQEPQVALYNSGSIRIDDTIPAGTAVTEYDVLRILPFGGLVVTVTLTGEVLSRTLDAGLANRGRGGYLQTLGVEGGRGAWKVGGEAISADETYRVALTDFLLTGKEEGLDFLTVGSEGVSDRVDGPDLRRAFIDRLAQGPGG
ncbi:MAG: bifunctional metallophosphatase/5'-nucleotidase [bacterium]